MKVTMRDIYGARIGITALIATKQPPGTAFKLLTLQKALAPKIEAFDKQRLEWIDELGTPIKINKPGEPDIDGPKQLLVDDPNFKEFEKRFDEVMAEEVELPGVEPIPFERLGDALVSAAELMSLGVFLAAPVN